MNEWMNVFSFKSVLEYVRELGEHTRQAATSMTRHQKHQVAMGSRRMKPGSPFGLWCSQVLGDWLVIRTVTVTESHDTLPPTWFVNHPSSSQLSQGCISVTHKGSSMFCLGPIRLYRQGYPWHTPSGKEVGLCFNLRQRPLTQGQKEKKRENIFFN